MERLRSKWVKGTWGYKCPCCGPSSKERDQARRYDRRAAANRWKREVRQHYPFTLTDKEPA